MLPPTLLSFISLLLTASPLTHAATSVPTEKPCTIHSPLTGSFYDLRPLQILPQPESADKESTNASYHSRGYDYPYNFTLNICAPVVEPLTSANGIPKSLVHNISAFYRNSADEVISIGQTNHLPIFRGKKLLLNYTNGSPCPDLDEDGNPLPESVNLDRRTPAILDDVVDEEDDPDDSRPHSHYTSKQSHSTSKAAVRRKTTILSFNCDTSPLLTSHPAVSFLGTPDHCTYIFEIRSRYACPGATPATDSGSLGPGSVFAIIFGIAFLVYLIGGCVYQRNVMHQRGWRQLPNYSVWAGLWAFFGVSLAHFLSFVVFWRRGKKASDMDANDVNGHSRLAFASQHKRSDSDGSERRRSWKPADEEDEFLP